MRREGGGKNRRHGEDKGASYGSGASWLSGCQLAGLKSHMAVVMHSLFLFPATYTFLETR